jgi:exodeoxyribonuclease V alpha subunit
VEPSTIHRLLKSLPNDRFRRNASDPLEADVVVVDETSMISLWMMSRLLEAVPPTCRLVFVGDPDQLVSIDAGTVLSDLVSSANSPHEATDADRVSAESDTDGAGGSPIPVTRLTVAHRFGGDESLTALFEAARMGNGARFFEVLGQNSAGDSSVRWIQPSIHAELLGELESELAEVGADSVVAARAGDIQSALSAMLDHGVLTSTRGGPGGLYDWTERIERRVVEVLRSRGLEAIVPGDPWYVGRPLMVTRNDLRNGVSNGDVGVVVAAEDDRGNSVRRVAIADKAGPPLEASRLDSLESWWAMTIHKSQGSEFPNVVVSLTRAESRVLSRQLLYTALTRASHKLTIVAERDAIEAALARPVSRGSRLGVRLLAQPNQV